MKLAFAHFDRLAAFGAAHRERLGAVAEIVRSEPLTGFDDGTARAVLAEIDVLVGHWGCPRLTDDVLDLAPQLRLFAYGAGTLRDVATPAVCDRITVTTASTANAVPVAEFTLAAIIFANKAAFAQAAIVQHQPAPATWPTLPPLGNRGRRVGLVGASTIGRLVIERVRAIDLEVELVVADPYLSAEEAAALGVAEVELDELLATSDVVSLHAPLVPDTVGMVGGRELALLRDGATLVNTARGGLVDWEALTAELMSGRISAVLDVTDPHEPVPPDWPPLARPNVFVTPHIAGALGTEVERLSELAVVEVERYAAGLPPAHPVRSADWGRIA